MGDRCFDAGLYDAARIIFNNVSNYSKLAITLVRFGDYQSAFECARKANATNVWKTVELSTTGSDQA